MSLNIHDLSRLLRTRAILTSPRRGKTLFMYGAQTSELKAEVTKKQLPVSPYTKQHSTKLKYHLRPSQNRKKVVQCCSSYRKS